MSKFGRIGQTWLAIIIAMSLLGIGLSIFTFCGIFKTAEAINIFLVAALVLVTAVYAKESERSRKAMEEQAKAIRGMAGEVERQRLDSCRPLLVPVGGKEGIARLTEVPRLDNEQGWLHVHNIGVGPAENIAIRLELRSEKGSPNVQLDEMLTTVKPLASGEKALCRQWKTNEKPVEIYDDHWIVISYDDLFHRHFETEARRIKESDSWVSIKTEQVENLRPRVREVDYYADASGRHENRK